MLASKATETKKEPVKQQHDKYFETNNYDTDYTSQEAEGGYNVSPVDNFS